MKSTRDDRACTYNYQVIRKQIGLALAVQVLILAASGLTWQTARGQDRPTQGAELSPDKAQRKQQLLEQLSAIQRELQQLDPDTPPTPAPVPASTPSSKEVASQEELILEPVEVLGSRIEQNLAGRAVGKVEREDIEHAKAFDLKELLEATPGISLKQGTGPRELGISIRGSGAKVGRGAIYNIKLYDDWFPMTASDGTSRTDIHDPHAYEGVDVLRGPSSAFYDNYALGGVINFRTRRGRDIRGIEVGNDGGSFGYHNHYVHLGDQHKNFEYSVFGSYVRGDGFIDHSEFHTSTENLLATITPDNRRSLTLKFLNNDLTANDPSLLTLAEYRANPRDAGRTFVTGKGTVTAEQAAQGRHGRRTVVGARYEQQVDASTSFRVLGEYDVRDLEQTFGTIRTTDYPTFYLQADVAHEGTVLGLNARHYAGLFFNYTDIDADSFNNLADYKGTRGALSSDTNGHQAGFGGRLREEVQFGPQWTGILGVGVETTDVVAKNRTRTAPETFSVVDVDRNYFSAAPEAALIYRYSSDLQVHARVGTGYGTPQIRQLTTTPAGESGNNTALKPQRNVGTELGIDWHPFPALGVNLTGYYDFFFNEHVTQSPGAGLSAFTSNAPRAEHRGIEVALDWRPFAGARISTAYTFNDHYYTRYTETICSSKECKSFDRSNNKIPGVERHILNGRLAYDTSHYSQWWRGVGGWIEVNWLDSFWVNNTNTLKTEPHQLVNLNLHYSKDLPGPYIRGLSAFFEIQNLFDVDYMASAYVVADSLSDTPANLATTKQAFLSGQERSFFAGLKLKF